MLQHKLISMHVKLENLYVILLTLVLYSIKYLIAKIQLLFFRIKKNFQNGRYKIIIDFNSEASLFLLSKSATRWQLNRHNLYSATGGSVKQAWGFPCRFCFWKIKMNILLLNFYSLFLSIFWQ